MKRIKQDFQIQHIKKKNLPLFQSVVFQSPKMTQPYLPELGMQQLFSFVTTTTQQRNRAVVTRKNTKNVKASVSKCSSHNASRSNIQ